MQLHEDTRKLFEYDEVSLTECEYQATQIFYTNEPQSAQDMDRITSVEFSRDGEHLAVGDHGGRIWIYSTNDGRNQCKPKPFRSFIKRHVDNEDDQKYNSLHDRHPNTKGMDLNEDQDDEFKDPAPPDIPETPPPYTMSRGLVYDFYGQFQSHQPEFDYLKSLEIEEKINCISWCRCANNSLSLLACNDKTIKLWKVFEKKLLRAESGDSFHKKFKTHSALSANRSLASNSKSSSPCPFINDSNPNQSGGFANVSLPTIECDDVITAAISRRVYQNGHKFHIHSLDVNCDCETFISADDLRINLWHFDSPSRWFTLCDLKPESMENLTNTVTKAILHPSHCNYMAYTTSQSAICVCDMRQNCQIRNNNTEFADHTMSQIRPSIPPRRSHSQSNLSSFNLGRNPLQSQQDAFASTKVFQYQQPFVHRDFFTDLAAYISDLTFSDDGHTMMSRDYFNIYVWDLRDNSKPLRIVPIHPYFANDMKHLYESDLLFDRFEMASSPSSMSVATGTYNNSFVVANWETNTIQKCVLNPNHVMQFQSRWKKQERKRKKLKKLKAKRQQMSQMTRERSAELISREQSSDGNRDEAMNEDDQKEKDVGTVAAQRENANPQRQQRQRDVRDSRDPRSRRNEDKSDDQNVVKPPWLQSSYFEKGNFDQKTLHLTWHPKKDVIAAVSGSQLLIFQKL